MAANKKATKSGGGSTPKKKSSAAQHARTRAQAQNRLAVAPPRRSHKEVDQSRFPGETPLTGEDRPRDRAGGKQQGFAQDRKPAGRGGGGGGAGRTAVHPGEMSLRRGRQKKRASARAD
jgi:hypothetical protein